MTEIVPARSAEEANALIEYLAGKLETDTDRIDCGPYEVFGIGRDGVIVGAVMFTRFADGDVEMTCAGEPGWTNRSSLRLIFSYPFGQLKCRRVTAIVHERNGTMRDYCERMGFTLEGVKRKALDGADAYIFGLLREDCKWA